MKLLILGTGLSVTYHMMLVFCCADTLFHPSPHVAKGQTESFLLWFWVIRLWKFCCHPNKMEVDWIYFGLLKTKLKKKKLKKKYCHKKQHVFPEVNFPENQLLRWGSNVRGGHLKIWAHSTAKYLGGSILMEVNGKNMSVRNLGKLTL